MFNIAQKCLIVTTQHLGGQLQALDQRVDGLRVSGDVLGSTLQVRLADYIVQRGLPRKYSTRGQKWGLPKQQKSYIVKLIQLYSTKPL